MIELPVHDFIRPEPQPHIPHGLLPLWHLIILHCELRCLLIPILPLIHLLEHPVIVGHRLLPHVTHEAVAGALGEEVAEGVGVEEDDLLEGQEAAEEEAGFPKVHQDEEVGALRGGFLQLVLDQGVVVLQGAQASYMTSNATDQPRDRVDSINKYSSIDALPAVLIVLAISTE